MVLSRMIALGVGEKEEEEEEKEEEEQKEEEEEEEEQNEEEYDWVTDDARFGGSAMAGNRPHPP